MTKLFPLCVLSWLYVGRNITFVLGTVSKEGDAWALVEYDFSLS